MAALIAISVAVAVISGSHRGAKRVKVATTRRSVLARSWVWRLQQEGVKGAIVTTKQGRYTLWVPASARVTAAAALDGSKQTTITTATSCPKASSFTTPSQSGERTDCLLRASVHDSLVSLTGVLEATVSISHTDEVSSLSSDSDKMISVVIRLDPEHRLAMTGSQLARMIGATAGIQDRSRITINDDHSRELWPATDGDSSRRAANENPCAQSFAGITDLIERERRMTACHEFDIRTKVAQFMAIPVTDVTVVAPVLLDPNSRQTVVRSVETGVNTQESTTVTRSGSGKDASVSTQRDIERVPTTRELTTETQAGAVASARISVGVRGASRLDLSDIRRMLLNAWPDAHVQTFAMRATRVTSTSADGTSPEGPRAATSMPTGAAARTSGVSEDQSTAVITRPWLVRHARAVSIAGVLAAALVVLGMAVRRIRRGRLARHDPDADADIARSALALSHAVAASPESLAREIEELLGQPGAFRDPTESDVHVVTAAGYSAPAALAMPAPYAAVHLAAPPIRFAPAPHMPSQPAPFAWIPVHRPDLLDAHAPLVS